MYIYIESAILLIICLLVCNIIIITIIVLHVYSLIDYKTEAMSYSPGIPVVINVEVTNNTGKIIYMYMCMDYQCSTQDM